MDKNVEIVKNIEPKEVFKYFAEISDVARGSGNTSKIADYLVDFATRKNLKWTRDDYNNVIIVKESANKKNSSVALQAHTDMVCVKTDDNKKDMTKEGIDFVIDGKYLRADRTTLGGDDGIGMSIALAILSNGIDYEREIVGIFTSDEETGMIGANNINLSNVKVNYLINIDHEDVNCIVEGCAGGTQLRYEKDCKLINKDNSKVLTLNVSGLLGGHSGMEITKKRGNANKIAINILYNFYSQIPFNLISIDGGKFDNAIPNLNVAKISIPANADDAKIIKILNDMIAEVKTKYEKSEADLNITFDLANREKQVAVFNDEDTKSIFEALYNLPDGLIATFEDRPDIAETSLNMGILKTDNDKISFTYLVRSNINEKRVNLVKNVDNIATKQNFKNTYSASYPAWEYKKTELEDVAKNIYKSIFNKDLGVELTHGGLECGILLEKLPGASAVSIGPTLYGAHSVDEKLEIETVKKIYDFVEKLLNSLS